MLRTDVQLATSTYVCSYTNPVQALRNDSAILSCVVPCRTVSNLAAFIWRGIILLRYTNGELGQGVHHV